MQVGSAVAATRTPHFALLPLVIHYPILPESCLCLLKNPRGNLLGSGSAVGIYGGQLPYCSGASQSCSKAKVRNKLINQH